MNESWDLLKKELDADIVEAFEKQCMTSDGSSKPVWYFISSPHLVAVNLQLIRTLKSKALKKSK